MDENSLPISIIIHPANQHDSTKMIDVMQNIDDILDSNMILQIVSVYADKWFDAITSHPNVIYLYPNALYAEISTNYEDNTISLIRGHGYLESEIDNGFDWEFANTRLYEFNKKCDDWEFYDIPSGKMLNCYPEQKIWKDEKFLKALKEL